MYGSHRAVILDTSVDYHNRHRMCFHLTFPKQTSGSGSWELVAHKADNKQCIKLKHRLKHESTLCPFSFFFVATSNENSEVENNSMYCAVFFFIVKVIVRLKHLQERLPLVLALLLSFSGTVKTKYGSCFVPFI